MLAHGTQDLPDHVAAEAEPVLVEAARRLDPPRLRRVIAHLRLVADPDGAEAQAERRYQQRGLWLSPTWEGMVAVNGLLDPEAGQTLLAALEPLARPTNAARHPHAVASAGPMPSPSWPAATWRPAGCPRAVGSGPSCWSPSTWTASSAPDGLGGEAGGPWPLDPETCRRLACDGAVTRVLVTRHRTHHHDGSGGEGGLAGWLQAAATRLPPALGGGPTQPLEVGRTSRVVTAAQRAALVVRDGGCVVAGCDRPPAWCEAHHLRHWLHGGPTDLANLALLCRAHHRAVHEGGWRLTRDPDGRLTATPPHRRPQRAPAAA